MIRLTCFVVLLFLLAAGGAPAAEWSWESFCGYFDAAGYSDEWGLLWGSDLSLHEFERAFDLFDPPCVETGGYHLASEPFGVLTVYQWGAVLFVRDSMRGLFR